MNTRKQTDNQATVLIIDDTAENRLLLSSQLGMEGYYSIQADGGEKGIQMAQEHNPDLILLDVMMPDKNGFEVCRELKQNLQTHLIPVIMITALRETQYRIEGIEVGADEFLSRPHVREELLVRVRTLIQLKHARVRIEEERNRLQLLYNISRAINTQLDLKSTMGEIITQTQAAVGATKGNIMLLDEIGRVKNKFLIRAGSQVEFSDQVAEAVMSRGLGGWLVRNRCSEIIQDINQDERWVKLPDDQGETGSAIGVPLATANHLVGVLILNHPQPSYFTKEHMDLLEAIGAQAAGAIENANLYTEASEERRKLSAILAQSRDSIITTDEQWRISLINQTAEKTFDLKASEVRGKSIRHIKELGRLVPLFEHARRHSDSHELTLSHTSRLYANVSPIEGVGYLAVMQDVTELRLIEEMKLERERRAKQREREEKQRVKETFSRYMGPRLVDHVLSHEPGLMAKRERRRAVVMFADLRNWTGGMMVKVTPDEAIEQLNEFFTIMMDIALNNDGTVFELTGDEILVGFNAPFDQPNAPFLAIKTAVTMQQKFNELRQKWFYQLGTELGLGIGINLGDIVMGNVGADTRLSFRMVGEAMNKASRLVDLAEDGQIVISRVVYDVLQNSQPNLLTHIPFRKAEGVRLKGIEEPQTLFFTQLNRTPLKTIAKSIYQPKGDVFAVPLYDEDNAMVYFFFFLQQPDVLPPTRLASEFLTNLALHHPMYVMQF